MKEYDPKKDSYILSCDATTYYIQEGRRYLVKKGKSPLVLLHIGGKRTAGGGKAFVCQCCDMEFDHPMKLGSHYQESTGCGFYRRRKKVDKVAKTRQKVTNMLH